MINVYFSWLTSIKPLENRNRILMSKKGMKKLMKFVVPEFSFRSNWTKEASR